MVAPGLSPARRGRNGSTRVEIRDRVARRSERMGDGRWYRMPRVAVANYGEPVDARADSRADHRHAGEVGDHRAWQDGSSAPAERAAQGVRGRRLERPTRRSAGVEVSARRRRESWEAAALAAEAARRVRLAQLRHAPAARSAVAARSRSSRGPRDAGGRRAAAARACRGTGAAIATTWRTGCGERSSAITLPSFSRLPGATSLISPRIFVTACNEADASSTSEAEGAAHSACSVIGPARWRASPPAARGRAAHAAWRSPPPDPDARTCP